MGKTIKTREYDVSEIKKGYYMCWNLCTQCGNASSVKLIGDNDKKYFEYEKKGGTSGKLEFMGEGHAECTSDHLKLVVTIETDTGEIRQSINSFGITDSHASKVGHGYNICIEDSTDEDYNDTYINLVGWFKKG